MSTAGQQTAAPGLIGRLFGPASAGRYAVIGISGVALDTVVFALLVQLGVAPVPATIVSTLTGIANNYVLNAKFNFGTGLDVVQGSRFLLVGLLGLAVAAGSLHLLMQWTGLSALPAKLVTVPFVVGSQFVANKYWSFRR